MVRKIKTSANNQLGLPSNGSEHTNNENCWRGSPKKAETPEDSKHENGFLNPVVKKTRSSSTFQKRIDENRSENPTDRLIAIGAKSLVGFHGTLVQDFTVAGTKCL